jgi:hypothetical protein
VLKQQLAEKVTFQQMLANTMDDKAYLSGGGVKGFALGKKLTNAFEQYQALLDQIGMIAHTVHEAGGVLEAARSYELFKYINRICVLFEQAGIQDERLQFFKNWSDMVYRVDRDATGALDRPGGVKVPDADSLKKASTTTDFGAPHTAPSDQFLLDNYGRFGEMVEQQGLELGKKAQTEGGGGGGPDGGKGGPDRLAPAAPAPAADGERRRGGHGLARDPVARRGRRGVPAPAARAVEAHARAGDRGEQGLPGAEGGRRSARWPTSRPSRSASSRPPTCSSAPPSSRRCSRPPAARSSG